MSAMWMVPSYRTRSWAYVQLPKVGDVIRYMNDGYDVRVTHIRRTYVLMSDGTTFRRRADMRKMWAWISKTFGKTVSRNNAPSSSEYVVRQRPLRPVTPYVQVVNLNV